MGGIAGWLDFGRDVSKQGGILREMTSALIPRGPDECGMYIRVHAALLHRGRTAGHAADGKQPMTARCGEEDIVLTFDGALYNAPELRRDLLSAGYRLNGGCDAELLLLSYLHWGRACVERLDGDFALAIYDARDKSLLLARDPLSAKPLFYAQRGTGLLFASSLRALLRHPEIPPRLTREGVAEVLLMSPARTPGCGVFAGISELQAGHMAVFEDGRLRVRPYWQLQARAHTDSPAHTVEQVRFLLEDAVCRRLPPQTPTGIFVQGGLNSGILAALAARQGRAVNSYSVNCAHSSGIRWMEEGLAVRHRFHEFDEKTLEEALGDAMRARDLPGMAECDSALLLLCGCVERDGPVALSAVGANELFGGTPWYAHDAPVQYFPWMRAPAFRAKLLLPERFGERFAAEYAAQRFSDALARVPLLHGESKEEQHARQLFALHLHHLLHANLERLDRMAMAHGLQIRAPFCSRALAEYLYNVPTALKVARGREKGLLRLSAEEMLPQEMVWRTRARRGPQNLLYADRVRRRLLRIFEDKKAPVWGMMKRSAVPELLTMDEKEPWYGEWMGATQAIGWVCQLDLWLREYKVELP